MLIREDDRADIVGDDHFLSTFIMKRNGINGQWLEFSLDVNLRATSDTYM
jgi:hypothetical protein